MTQKKIYPENASTKHPSLEELTAWLDLKIETALTYSLDFSSDSNPPSLAELIHFSSLLKHILLLNKFIQTMNDKTLSDQASMSAMEDFLFEFNQA